VLFAAVHMSLPGTSQSMTGALRYHSAELQRVLLTRLEI
jgi:hypothetical protein